MPLTLGSLSPSLSAQLIPRWGFGLVWLGLLYTSRAAGALKGWCAVRTLQAYSPSSFVQSRAKKMHKKGGEVESPRLRCFCSIPILLAEPFVLFSRSFSVNLKDLL